MYGAGRCVVAAGAGVLAALSLAPGSAASEAPPDRFDTVVVDAGHGGDDRGARGPQGLLEKDLVLDLSRRLALRLRDRGVRVVLTRDGDAFVPLERRTALANDARGDLFVSIHANAARDPKVRGIETFFLSLRPTDAYARDVAHRENAAFPASPAAASALDDPLVALLGDLAATSYLEESSDFAHLAQERLAAAHPAPSRGVKQALFVVLFGVQMPAALVEIGFVTNPEDERALASPRGREAIAEALATAVLEFGERYDARRGVDGAPLGPSGSDTPGPAGQGRR